LKQFDHCFFINAEKIPSKEFLQENKKIIFIFINNTSLVQTTLKKIKDTKSKIIQITGNVITKENVEKILWFSFSQTSESFFQLRTQSSSQQKKLAFNFSKLKLLNKKSLFISLLKLFILGHLAFVIPLILSSFFFYKATVSFRQEKASQSQAYINLGEPSLYLAKKLYILPRSTLSTFSLTMLPDDLFAINEKTASSLQRSLITQENLKNIVQLILKKGKSQEEKKTLLLRFDRMKKDFVELEDNLNIINQKIPQSSDSLKSLKEEIGTTIDLISQLKQVFPYLDSIFAKNTTKKYLLLFANNMELRPGGGFIGSFGELTISDYTLSEIKIYDVYDADGQLIAHVEPPEAIRTFLGQPHWFLRDSAFSPDFLENYIRAKFFLEKEMRLQGFSGGVLLTTTAIQNILGAFDELYLPDFAEKINQKNFYLKAQLYSENNFFPGSTQKKNFLASLTQYLLLNLDNVSPIKLGAELKKSLDEKQIVLYFDHPKFQDVIDSVYWSGRAIESTCPKNVEDCIADYIFPFEANLGVNKANFFVRRTFDLNISIDREGKIDHNLSILFANDSPNETFLGGIYKNYFQSLFPKNTIIKRITKDGVLIEDYVEKNDQYNSVGLYFEVQPKTQSELKINYELDSKITKGKNVFQLIVQKQTGGANSDLSIRLSFPSSIHLLNQNFSALVKNNQIIYNTTLSTDKIFFIELTKE
ncbi:DUF4012 domain-containing protein, partial [Candidatus Roizmanbacteria bacterium]|nr:DUF4012 domain-containing protein [Candidatus Roizmanbacteria bacterium]